MFGAFKAVHNASKFSTKLGLAYNWPDDHKVPLWISEAHSCFQKVIATGEDRTFWDEKESTKYAIWLSSVYPVVSDPAIQQAMAQMHEYFTIRSAQG